MKQALFAFSLVASEVTLHEPVFVDFSIHNGLQEDIAFDLGHDRKSNFEFTITKPDGSSFRAPRLSEEGLGRVGRMSLKPGESYRQKLLVNQWYQFDETGKYKLSVRLVVPGNTQSGMPLEFMTGDDLLLQVHARNPAKLEEVCRNLTQTALASTDIEDSNNAVMALSYINDPVAVGYLEEVLKTGKGWQYAIPGLGRIANERAVEILISIMENRDPERGSSLARFVLEQLKGRIQERALREKITTSLKIK
jgi:hypothetical protein